MRLKYLILTIATSFTVGCGLPEVEIPVTEKTIDTIRSFFGDGNNALVYTRDIENTTGAAAIVDLDKLELLAGGIGEGELSNDLIMQSDDRFLYLIDRTQSSVTVLDPLNEYAELKQFSTGSGTNPKAVVRLADKLYITRYDSTSLLVVDAKNFEEVTTIDFSKYASPADIYPEMGFAVTAEGKVWVAVERYDRTGEFWSPSTLPTEGGMIVGIDPATDTIVDEVQLQGDTPFQALKIDPATGHIYTVSADGWNSGIELVNLSTKTSEGFLVDPSSYPEGLNFALLTQDHIYTVENDQGYTQTVLKALNRTTNEVIEVVRSSEGYFGLACLEISPSNVIVTCAGPGIDVSKPGLRVFDGETHEELTAEPLGTGLAPFGVAFFARPETETVNVPVTDGTNPVTDSTK